MLSRIIEFSIKKKFVILFFTLFIVGFGLYGLLQISIGAVPDVTNNQVQVITTSRNLSTQDMEQFITYPVELEMANLPGVQEIRSTSKFGLSVVTIVFDDDLGTYLPRQLIAEKIKSLRYRLMVIAVSSNGQKPDCEYAKTGRAIVGYKRGKIIIIIYINL